MHLSLLTYNIHKGIGNDRRYRLDRIIEVLRSVDADILCLQEVDRDVPRSRQEDLARIISEELGFQYDLGLNVKLKRGAYGNATLSRFPIVESRNMNITWGIKKRRGCLITTIDSGEQQVVVLNLHLGLAAFERMHQIKKIIGAPSVQSLRSRPMLVAGDTNDRADKLNPVLGEAGLRDCWNGQKKGAATFPAYAPIFRLDKVFASHHWTVQEVQVVRNQKTQVASDHLPVVAKLQLRRSGS